MTAACLCAAHGAHTGGTPWQVGVATPRLETELAPVPVLAKARLRYFMTALLSAACLDAPQMDFAGLHPTHATYHDKMALMNRLRQEHGMAS